MKTVLVLLFALSFSVFAQDTTVTKTWQTFHSDSLTTTRDTVDVTWGSERANHSGYALSIYSDAADTVLVQVQDDAGNWFTCGVSSSLTDAGTVLTEIITTTGYVRWYLLEPSPFKFRFRNATLGNSSETFFTLSAY